MESTLTQGDTQQSDQQPSEISLSQGSIYQDSPVGRRYNEGGFHPFPNAKI
jgi:hypothetical protein